MNIFLKLWCEIVGHKRMKYRGPISLVGVGAGTGRRYVCPRCGHIEDRKVRVPKPAQPTT
jgi:hypothetical protein